MCVIFVLICVCKTFKEEKNIYVAGTILQEKLNVYLIAENEYEFIYFCKLARYHQHKNIQNCE